MPKRVRCVSLYETFKVIEEGNIPYIFGGFTLTLKTNCRIILAGGGTQVLIFEPCSPIIKVRGRCDSYIQAYQSSSPRIITLDDSAPRIASFSQSSPFIRTTGNSHPNIRVFDVSSPVITVGGNSTPLIRTHDKSTPLIKTIGSGLPRIVNFQKEAPQVIQRGKFSPIMNSSTEVHGLRELMHDPRIPKRTSLDILLEGDI